jgi:hypothetical protein
MFILRNQTSLAAFVICLLALSALPAGAVSVLQMNLEELVDNSDKIFRGTVLDIRETTVTVGGGTLPVVVYRFRVDEAFKGTFQESKGMTIAEVRMLGKLKTGTAGSPMHASSIIPELPRLQVGQDYLLLVTRSSTIGLSTTVGLGQGRFELRGKPGQEVAINGNNNRGLFGSASAGPTRSQAGQQEGPLPYTALAGMIRGIVGQ